MNIAALRSAVEAASQLDFFQFCQRLGIYPDDPRSQRCFDNFQTVALQFRKFRPREITRLLNIELDNTARMRKAARLVMNAHAATTNGSRARSILRFRDAIICGDDLQNFVRHAPDEATRVFFSYVATLSHRSALATINDALAIAFEVSSARMQAWTASIRRKAWEWREPTTPKGINKLLLWSASRARQSAKAGHRYAAYLWSRQTAHYASLLHQEPLTWRTLRRQYKSTESAAQFDVHTASNGRPEIVVQIPLGMDFNKVMVALRTLVTVVETDFPAERQRQKRERNDKQQRYKDRRTRQRGSL